MKENNQVNDIRDDLFQIKVKFRNKDFKESLIQSSKILNRIDKIAPDSALRVIFAMSALRIRIESYRHLKKMLDEPVVNSENLSNQPSSQGRLQQLLHECSTSINEDFDDLDFMINSYLLKAQRKVKFDATFEQSDICAEDIFCLQIELFLLGNLYNDLGREHKVNLSSMHMAIEKGLAYSLDKVKADIRQYEEIEIQSMIQQYSVSISSEFIINELKKRFLDLASQNTIVSKHKSSKMLIKYERLFMALEACLAFRPNRQFKEIQLLQLCFQAARNRNSKLLPLYIKRIEIQTNRLNAENYKQLTKVTYHLLNCCRNRRVNILGMTSIPKKKSKLDLIRMEMDSVLLKKVSSQKNNYSSVKNQYETLMKKFLLILEEKGSTSTDSYNLLDLLDKKSSDCFNKHFNKTVKLLSKVANKKDSMSQTLVSFAVGYLTLEQPEPKIKYINVSKLTMFSGSPSAIDAPLQLTMKNNP